MLRQEHIKVRILEPQRKYLESLTEQIMTGEVLEPRQTLLFTKSAGHPFPSSVP